MKCRRNYADQEKYRRYHNGCNRRYYKKTENAPNKGMLWTDGDIVMILERKHSDTELSAMIGRSVRAIQMKRSKLKKEVQTNGSQIQAS